jgi:hypothetical protein
MQLFTKITFIILLSFFIFHLSFVQAQEILGGEYMLVQYILEDDGHRSVMHFQLLADGDTSGTYKELYREQGEPDSGSFSYFMNEDRTFIIPEEDDDIHGIIDDQGDVFSIVSSDSGFALYGIGIRKSSGRTAADLSGEYWISEFVVYEGFQAVGLDYADFNGADSATLYRIENTVGELDTFGFSYSVDDDGAINFDDDLDGIISPDGKMFVAGKTIMDEGENSTYIIGIKKSTGIDNSTLSGSYIYNQVQTESGGLSEETSFFARVNFDGEGEGEVVMFLGEAESDTFEYNIESDGSFEIDSTLGAISMDGRYFFNIELGDEDGVAYGLGIRGEEPSLSVENILTDQTPASFVLEQNFPNPFNPSTIINYELRMTNDVKLSVYNLLGQKITTLVSGKQSAGRYQVEWDATGFASGVYYYSLEAGDSRSVRKMVLVR